MKLNWSHILIPAVGALVAGQCGSVGFWEASKAPLLTALSVIAAGVLVRLARGLPFNAPGHFELDEARQIAQAMKKSIRALRVLIITVFITMGFLVFAKPIHDAITSELTTILTNSKSIEIIEKGVSGAIGLLLSYISIRILNVIKGDVSLVDLQSDFLVKAVARKQAENFEKTISKTDLTAIKNPEGYGKIIQ